MGRSVMSPTAAALLLLFHTVINDSHSRSLATAPGEGKPEELRVWSRVRDAATLTRFQRAEIKAAKRCFDE